MKRVLMLFFLFIILFLLIPLFGYQLITSPQIQETAAFQQSSPFSVPQEITVYLVDSDEIITLDLESCVAAILALKKNDLIPLEALKAQAVASRSYLLYQIYANQQTRSSHPDAMLCNDGSHCMNFLFENSDSTSIQQALAETTGQYLCYQHWPARCFSFHTSAGKTESALDVWGLDFPYLISVESSWDNRSFAYQSKVIYPLEAFQLVLKGARHDLRTDTQPILGEIKRTNVGHVKFITINNKTFTGEEIRQLFHLKSTNFTLFIKEEQVVFEVKGDGHGVGMSQFGAQEMAKNGADYLSILAHYYPETTITTAHQIN